VRVHRPAHLRHHAQFNDLLIGRGSFWAFGRSFSGCGTCRFTGVCGRLAASDEKSGNHFPLMTGFALQRNALGIIQGALKRQCNNDRSWGNSNLDSI
jgi:hypothetical protein